MEYLEKIAYTEVLLSPTDVNELFGKSVTKKTFYSKAAVASEARGFKKILV